MLLFHRGELQDAADINATHNADMDELNKQIDASKKEGEILG